MTLDDLFDNPSVRDPLDFFKLSVVMGDPSQPDPAQSAPQPTGGEIAPPPVDPAVAQQILASVAPPAAAAPPAEEPTQKKPAAAKVDVGAAIVQNTKLLALIAEKLGVVVPPSLMVVTPQDVQEYGDAQASPPPAAKAPPAMFANIDPMQPVQELSGDVGLKAAEMTALDLLRKRRRPL
jgi:hypothetical protein